MAASQQQTYQGLNDSTGLFHLVVSKRLQIRGTVCDKKVFLAQGAGIPSESNQVHCFCTQELEYVAFCDDFGPMNASTIINFVQILQTEIIRYPTHDIVYCAEPGRRNLTNAAFLLGSYLILVFNESPKVVWEQGFTALHSETFEAYRDATFSDSTFDLSLLDCWQGLARAKSIGWIEKPVQQGIWGKIILEEYEHYENPLNGDLHIVVPDCFVAFKGPKDLPGGREHRDSRGTRDFSPKYYVDIFAELGVKAVVRLNESLYDETVFEQAGIAHHDLEFEDCTSPPDAIVDRFFRIVDETEGLVAVHCKAGLGRTGTLIALDLMRRHRFTAREAMGWLRIMRPGMVIGEQQAYLCQVEEAVRAAETGTPFCAPPAAHRRSVSPARGGDMPDSAALARQVAEAMDRRAAGRIDALRPTSDPDPPHPAGGGGEDGDSADGSDADGDGPPG